MEGVMAREFTIVHFNTWRACLYKQDPKKYISFMQDMYDADVVHLSEVHSVKGEEKFSIAHYFDSEKDGVVRPILLNHLQLLMQYVGKTHNIYFAPQIRGIHDLNQSRENKVEYGNVTMVRENISHHYHSRMIYRDFNETNDGLPSAKSGQSVIVKTESGYVQSVGFHGHWDVRGKIDTSKRSEQMGGVIDLITQHQRAHCGQLKIFRPHHLIVGGDMNLTTASECLHDLMNHCRFGENGALNLVKEAGIKNTRTEYYPDNKPSREANHVLVNRDAQIRSFEVLQDDVLSDHALLRTTLNLAV